MTDPAGRTAALARRGYAMPDLRALPARLGRMLAEQVDALEADPAEAYSEGRVKALMLITKTLQAMDDMVRQQEREDDGGVDRPDDILEFRAELARRLAALGADGEAGDVPGGPRAAASEVDSA